MESYFNVAQIIVALVLISVVLLQVKGGGLGGIFGSQTGAFRTKRGIEKTLFKFTILLIVVLVVVSIFAVRAD